MSLLKFFNDIERVVQTRCLTVECEVLLSVLENPNSSAGHLFSLSSYSSTTFYAALKKLTESGVISSRPHLDDRRTNLYTISAEYKDKLRSLPPTFRISAE